MDAGAAYVFVSTPANAAPVVNAGPGQSAIEGAAFNLTASFTDADASDTHTATVNWGDNSSTEAAMITEPAGGNPGAVNGSHTYLAPGSYTVTVSVTDNANASGSDTLQVTVGSCSPTNAALMSAGATATASSSYPGGNFPAAGAINGDRKGLNWGAGGDWNDATRSVYPDLLQVDFNGSKRINQISVYTAQNDLNNPSEPTPEMTSVYSLTDFDMQYWDGSQWVTPTGGSIRGTNKVMTVISFPAVTTTKIRVLVTNAQVYFSRIAEIEAIDCAAP